MTTLKQLARHNITFKNLTIINTIFVDLYLNYFHFHALGRQSTVLSSITQHKMN